MHSIVAGTSKLFQEFVGRAFTDASSIVHKRYSICLIGIGQNKFTSELSLSKESLDYNPNQSSNIYTNRNILLNPGPGYKIKEDDLCLYIALVKEENLNFKDYRFKNCKQQISTVILKIISNSWWN